jgi:hypothetical protein
MEPHLKEEIPLNHSTILAKRVLLDLKKKKKDKTSRLRNQREAPLHKSRGQEFMRKCYGE